MSFIIDKYIRKDATTKHASKNRKFSFVLSIISNEISSHIISLGILKVRNLRAASCLLYKNFLKIIYTAVFRTTANVIIIKTSRKFMLQK